MGTTVQSDTTIGDLIKSGRYGIYAKYFFTDMTPDHFHAPLSSYGFEKNEFAVVLSYLEDLASTGKDYRHFIYDETTRLSEWDKEPVCLFEFPVPSKDMPYAIVIPGGGFNRQWGLIEGFCIAKKLRDHGIPSFVLFYRVKQEPVLGKALEDVHTAISYVEDHAETLGVKKGHYILGGFSAGATLASEIGSTNLGFSSAGLPKPELIFLGYPEILHRSLYEAYAASPENKALRSAFAPFLRRIGGPDFSLETMAEYELSDHMDSSYPKCYITACEDDQTVDPENSRVLDRLLTDLKVPHKLNLGKQGGHSFGIGNGVDTEGWIEDMLSFWKQNDQN
ncbi:MAG: alpha/beta hydrolase [Lachnospiraceae bacterium]|nr:alpha/beta hydrolase [Lachnospiraceae bacterium]